MRKLIIFLFVIMCICITIKAQINLQDGLVAYYPLNGDANDESGNKQHGTIHGASLVTDRNGNPNSAYSFNGVSDYIEIAHTEKLNISKEITISCWIQYNAGIASKFEDIVMKGNNTYGFQFSRSGGEIMFHLRYSGWKNLNSGVVPEANKWYHIIGTFDGNTQKIYVNNILKATDTWTGTIETSTDPLSFGYNVAFDNNWYKGILDDVRIYNRALNEAEVESLYKENGYAQISDNPNLKPEVLNIVWNDPMPISNSKDLVYDANLTEKDNLYIAFGYVNENHYSAFISENFKIKLYVDNNLIYTLDGKDSYFDDKGYNIIWGIEHVPLSSGNHTVKLHIDSENEIEESNESDNIYEKTIYIQETSTSITNELNETIFISANPITKELLKINGLTKSSELEIYSLRGKMIKNQFINNGEINISELKQGVYFLRIKRNGIILITQKIVKQ